MLTNRVNMSRSPEHTQRYTSHSSHGKTQWRIQDFPEGGAWTLQGGREHAKFSRKLHEIERIWTPRGGACVPHAPPRSANETFKWISLEWNQLIEKNIDFLNIPQGLWVPLVFLSLFKIMSERKLNLLHRWKLYLQKYLLSLCQI